MWSPSAAGIGLGTVQFGLAYGVAGRGQAVPPDEVRAILEVASTAGVRTLDTAPAYGDIEARILELASGLDFRIVSKISPAPESTSDAIAAIQASVERSQKRLGQSLETLLFHRAEDLLRPDGDALWRAAVDAAGPAIRVGISAYDPDTVAALRGRVGVAVAQLPANAFDQRLAGDGLPVALEGVELHARSVFLQGLLLMPLAEAVRRVPVAAESLSRWSAWCAAHDGTRVAAALSVARGLPGVAICVVGVDRASHLREVLDADADAPPCIAPELACIDMNVIDPRRWPAI